MPLTIQENDVVEINKNALNPKFKEYFLKGIITHIPEINAIIISHTLGLVEINCLIKILNTTNPVSKPYVLFGLILNIDCGKDSKKFIYVDVSSTFVLIPTKKISKKKVK